jgi:SAM-dependent methyltransferase
MRDPLGSITITETKVHRTLYQALPLNHLLYNKVAMEMVKHRELIAFEFVNDKEIISPRIPFVSYPYEWCNAQFMDAAKLTLSISEQALTAGCELKDASAWNVIFDGCKPIFCDHLSFQTISRKQWWAFAQFVKHFVLPLCIAKYRHLNANNSFKINHDGLSPDHAQTLMGLKRFLTRYWLLMLKPRLNGIAEKTKIIQEPCSHHKNLYVMTRWFLSGVSQLHQRKSTWINYTEDRNHYSKKASLTKYQMVQEWLTTLKPNWVTDLGCNTGEFSKLAARLGAKVVAIDLDHESIQDIYLSNQGEPIYPVVANLEDIAGGRGWSGDEFPSLLTRLESHADLVLMLALIHHLAISSSVPYDDIAKIANRLSKRYLIVEMVDATDPLVQRLAGQHDRHSKEFSITRQQESFGQHFKTLEDFVIPESGRHLVLMEKR